MKRMCDILYEWKIKFEYTFQDGISSFIPLDKDNEYIYINKDYIRKIKLR